VGLDTVIGTRKNVTPEEFIGRFNNLLSWEDRYRYLIQIGRKLEAYPEEYRDGDHLVPGCLSQVWLVSLGVSDEGKMDLRADSDAHIVKGLIALLFMMYANKTAAEILLVDIEGLFEKLNLGKHLSVNRRNGFYSLNHKIREHASNAVAG